MSYAKNWTLMTLTVTALAAGCSAQGKVPPKVSDAAPSADIQASTVTDQTDLFVKNPNLKTVYFANGQTKLDAQGEEIAKKNLEWLRPNLPLHMEIAGYSDGRGTPEQNLMVGQRRASALRDFYVTMGLPRSRISTVSLGEEEPACYEDTDDCHAKNRRAETLIENKALASR